MFLKTLGDLAACLVEVVQFIVGSEGDSGQVDLEGLALNDLSGETLRVMLRVAVGLLALSHCVLACKTDESKPPLQHTLMDVEQAIPKADHEAEKKHLTEFSVCILASARPANLRDNLETAQDMRTADATSLQWLSPNWAHKSCSLLFIHACESDGT